MGRSTTRFQSIAKIFRWSSEEEKKMQVQLARLCVLYEDAQIEWAGALAEEIKGLERSDRNGRRFYFARRILATIQEIESAIGQLQRNKEFKRAKLWWAKESLDRWDEAVRFFETEHQFLRDWRNDVGGHFHDSAADYAISNVHEKSIGSMEVYRRGRGADVKVAFAFELVALAMTKNKAATQNEEDFLARAFTFLKEASAHSIYAGQVITVEMLLPRFV